MPTVARKVVTLAVSVAIALTAGIRPAQAKVFMTQEEALRLAFPGGPDPERVTSFLTDEQAAAVEKQAGQPLTSRVVTWYRRGGVTAWFDTHVVRTLPETIMVVVSPKGEIVRIDILSFSEPDEYRPRDRWMQQLNGHELDDQLSLRGGIRPITGASLSARAIVGASRRVLSLRRTLALPAAPATPPSP